jgi:hypothetical protein
MPWYKSGTVSVTQNSNAVIGTGTAFIANGRVGDAFQGPDGDWYEVTNIASDTAMSVAPNYRGATNPAGSYALAPMQGYNKDTADALRAASLQVGDALDGLDESVAEAAESAATATAAKIAAQASATAAAGSASASETSKNEAATSATASAASAAGAAGSATAANTSKVAAAQSETNAATSATNSGNSATAAANSAAASAASAGTAANLGVGKGFIEGLQMVWVSLTSIQVLPGSCYMPNLSRVYKVPATLTVAPPAGVTGFGHIYLYDNAGTPALEMVTTDPVSYWNDARNKTGDATRRYIGSVLLSSGSAFNFRHYPSQGRVSYTYGTPALSPFNVLSGGTATTATVVSAAAICPPTATHVEGLLSASGTGSVYIGNEEYATPLSGSNWLFAALTTGYMAVSIPFALNNSLRRFQYLVAGGGTSAFVSVSGYIFGR